MLAAQVGGIYDFNRLGTTLSIRVLQEIKANSVTRKRRPESLRASTCPQQVSMRSQLCPLSCDIGQDNWHFHGGRVSIIHLFQQRFA